MDVVVFGAGSLGSLLGGLLAREHHVTLVGRDPHVRTVRERGLRVGGEYSFTVHPDATLDVPDRANLALIAVKAFDTDSAAAALEDVELDVCLSVQNGVGNEATLAAMLDLPVLAGTCTYGATLPEPGRVDCTGVGELAIGAREGGPSEVADQVGSAFSAASIETIVSEDMPRRLWEKLAVNCAINATTALARVENGAVLDGPVAPVAVAAAREAAHVARLKGVDLPDVAAVEAVERVAEATAANTSSMHQDVLAEKRTEVDALNGAVVAGEGVTPVNHTLAGLIRAWEADRGLR